jgi:hypothetical protein
MLKFGVDTFGEVLNKRTKFHLTRLFSTISESFTILKFNRTTLRGIYNKGVKEGKGRINF